MTKKQINKLFKETKKIGASVLYIGHDIDGDVYALVELENGTPSKVYYDKEIGGWV